MKSFLLYLASAVILILGIARLALSRKIIGRFAALDVENKSIIIREWVASGFMLILLGEMIFFVTLNSKWMYSVDMIIYWISTIFLLALVLLSIFTSAKSNMTILKIEPFVLALAAAIILIAQFI